MVYVHQSIQQMVGNQSMLGILGDIFIPKNSNAVPDLSPGNRKKDFNGYICHRKKEKHERIQTLLEGFNVVPLLCNEYWKQEASYSLVLRRVTPEEDVKFRFCGVK